MYKCERCGGTFTTFKTAGLCPHCGVRASVRCSDCAYTAHANEFINNRDRCPRCGARVSVGNPGNQGNSPWEGAGSWLIWIVIFIIWAIFGQH